MSNDLLQKVVDTTTLGAGGGILRPVQSRRFIDYMWDATVLGDDVRQIRMREPVMEIDKIGVGQRIARKATEGVDDHVNVDPAFSKLSMTTTKIRLDWELTTEALEDGIEGEALEDHIARLMANQLGNDLEDLAINGDVDSTDPLISAFDGYTKLADNNARVVDAAGNNLTPDVFNAALKEMPARWMQRRNQLKWYTSAGLRQDFLYGLRNTNSFEGIIFGQPFQVTGDGQGATGLAPFGIPMFEVPLFREDFAGDYSGATGNHGRMELTFPQNRLWGIHREITVYREFKPKKDTIEYTVFTRVGVQIEHYDNFVVVKNIAVA